MNWKSLRVEADTLSALTRYRDALQVQVNGNHKKYARFAPHFRVSLGDAIQYLLDQKDAHTKRSKGFDAGGRAKDKQEDNSIEITDEEGNVTGYQWRV